MKICLHILGTCKRSLSTRGIQKAPVPVTELDNTTLSVHLLDHTLATRFRSIVQSISNWVASLTFNRGLYRKAVTETIIGTVQFGNVTRPAHEENRIALEQSLSYKKICEDYMLQRLANKRIANRQRNFNHIAAMFPKERRVANILKMYLIMRSSGNIDDVTMTPTNFSHLLTTNFEKRTF